MLRLTPKVATALDQLITLVGQIQLCEYDTLGYAMAAGDVLITAAPGAAREALATQAGITGRSTMFTYVRLAEHRETVQRAGLRSIREALAFLGRPPRSRGRAIPLPFDDLGCAVTLHVETGWCESDG